MSAAEKIARLDRSIARAGDVVTLRRLSVDGATGAESVVLELANVPSHVRTFSPQDLLDSGDNVADVKIVISATQILAATIGSPAVAFDIPVRDDRVIFQGASFNVHRVEPIWYAGALVRVNLLCRGGGG